jgi:two-component system OmpR family response regulator
MDQINVLLVDDEEELVTTWVERIELRGMNAEGVTNGNDAIKIAREKDFNVVVLDIKMPGIDGFEIMKRIKAEKPNIPIILITGHQCVEEENKGPLAKAFDCLVKPVNIEILIDKIKKAVKR